MKKTIMTLAIVLAAASSVQAQAVADNEHFGNLYTEYQNAERDFKSAKDTYDAADKQVSDLKKQVNDLKEQLKKAQTEKKNAKATYGDRKSKRDLAKKNCKAAGIDPKTGKRK